MLCVADEVVSFFILRHCIGVWRAADGADAVGAELMVGLCGVALRVGVGERHVVELCTVAAYGAGGIDARSVGVGDGSGIRVDGLCPPNVRLVGIEFVAERTVGYLFFAYLLALHFSYGIDVVTVVEDVCSSAECEAIACASAFGETAGCVAVVEGGGDTSRGECHEAAVHGAAFVAHFAERGTVVEGDVAVECAYHAAVAGDTAALSDDDDIGDDVLDEHRAAAISDECAVVDATGDDVALHA